MKTSLSTGLHAGRLQASFPYLMLFLYMATVSRGSLPEISQVLSSAEGPLLPFRPLFTNLHMMLNRWSYKHHQACMIAATLVKDKAVKGFFLRLAQAIVVGTTVRDFMKIEYGKYTLTRQGEFQRMIEKLRGFSEAYSAILSAGTFLSVTMIVTGGLLGGGFSGATLVLTFGGVLAAAGSIALLVFLTAGRMPLTIDSDAKPLGLKLIESIAKRSLIPILVSGPTFLLFMVMFTDVGESGDIYMATSIAFLMPGAALLLIGRLGYRWLNRVKRLDSYYPIFIKTLGDAASVAGSLKNGLGLIVRNDYGPINPFLTRLVTRINTALKSELCWDQFAHETGSRLIATFTKLFITALSAGGKIIETAYAIFDATNEEIARRTKREQVGTFLKGLTAPLQGTLVSVMSLTAVLMTIFNRFAAFAKGGYVVVAPVDPLMITLFAFAVGYSMAVVSGLTIYAAEGSSIFVFFNNTGILLTLSAGVGYLVATFSNSLLSAFTNLASRLSEVAVS